MSNVIKKTCSVFLSCLVVFSMLLALPLTSFADDQKVPVEENVVEIENEQDLHDLFDELGDTNLYGRLRVVLQSDITTNKGVSYSTNREDNEMIFDLNGHSITVHSDSFDKYNVLTVSDKANVVITGNGKLFTKASGPYDNPSAIDVFGGNVKIENGTFEGATALTVFTSTFDDDTSRSSVTINGGSFIGDSALSVTDGSVVINDGIFTCNSAEDYSTCVDVDTQSTLVIHGGKFEGGSSPGGYIFNSEGAVFIDGGTFTGSNLMFSTNWAMYPGMLYQISGGDFTGVGSVFYLFINPIPSEQLIVTGGTFTDAQKEDILESTKSGDSDYSKAIDLKNYWQEDFPVLEYTGKALRPAIDMTVTLSDGYQGLRYFDTNRYKYSISYKNNTNIGVATVTFTGKSVLKGTAKATFTIVPKKAVWKKVKAGKKSFTATVKAQKGGVRYQIQYRTGNGKWKSKKTGKTSLTVKKLKSKKKYQVRVRSYKKVNGKTYYGKWSKTKTVKVK